MQRVSIVGRSRYGDMVIWYDVPTRTIQLNSERIRAHGVIPFWRPRPRRFLPQDIHDHISSFLDQADRVAYDVALDLAEDMVADSRQSRVYVDLHGYIRPEFEHAWPIYLHCTADGKNQNADRTSITCLLDVQDGRCEVHSYSVPEFWLHFTIPPEWLPRSLSKKRPRDDQLEEPCLL